jgi:phosphoribosyl 1,2-cyclic phosphate phosphodiesterase
MIGCDCETCTSTDPRDARFRSSVLVEWHRGRVVVDTTPEFRLQMLRAHVNRLDAVLLTHNHADHVQGLDDIRQFNFRTGEAMPVYATRATLDWVRRRFDYVWDALQVGGGLPRLDLVPVDGPFTVAGLRIVPIPVKHGLLDVLGFRFGDFAYISDVSEIPDSSYALLEGVRTLVLDAVQYRPHRTHFHLDAAIAASRRVGAARTYLTHLNHRFLHRRLAAQLPPAITPAHDGLVVEEAAGPRGHGPQAAESVDDGGQASAGRL